MPFERPTLDQLVTRIQTAFTSRVELQGSVLRRAMVTITARVLAGVAHLLHGRLDYYARQLFADEAEDEFLKRWGAMFGVTPQPPTYSGGSITATGDNGSVIPAGTLPTRTDAAICVTKSDATIASGTATIAVVSQATGSAQNSDVGTELTFQSPI